MLWSIGLLRGDLPSLPSRTATSLQVSALLGRIPSAVGYQPTLATDMGMMQERITTTTKGSITSVQASASHSAGQGGRERARVT